MKKLAKKPELKETQYGFNWGECKVERIASNLANPKFQILGITTPNGDHIEIIMRPRSTMITQFRKDLK